MLLFFAGNIKGLAIKVLYVFYSNSIGLGDGCGWDVLELEHIKKLK
ncbi:MULTISPECIES: hypothetical protein [unclassified Myroides]|nr:MULTISPECIES: hypothetical protein [unclassified Myroides]MBB1150105.1 hypothetical protein [Myroides sp. NP-2]MDM1408325.1 hypothetical protein [Myroides sp. DF42-4-2]